MASSSEDIAASTTDNGEVSEASMKNPDLSLAALRYAYIASERITGTADAAIKQQLLDAITANNMAPFYQDLCHQFKWPIDDALLQTMTQANEEVLRQQQEKLKSCEETEGESEVRAVLFSTADFYARIGDKAKAELAFRKTAEKTVGLGLNLDLAFALIRIGFFHGDIDMVVRNIDKAKTLLEGGGDWDRRNKLKVYEAVYFLSIRNFKKAAELFLDTLSTFTSYELFDYNTFIFYTVITSVVSLDRPRLRQKVIDAPEVLGVIADIPHLQSFLRSFYDSNYKDFFLALANISDRIKTDWLLGAHNRYFVREMRILAYAQLLESYQSVQLNTMAEAFGVSTEFLDNELSRFIAAGRLHCKIDKVGGIVETNRPDKKNAQYQATIRQGDLLLNRIQKLSRVINV